MASRIGMPNFDDEELLDDDPAPCGPAGAGGGGAPDVDDEDEDDDDDLFVTPVPAIEKPTVHAKASFLTSAADSAAGASLIGWVPQSMFKFSDKPPLPYLGVEALPRDTLAYLIDAEDVSMMLGQNWERSYHALCAGKGQFRVIRHSGAFTYVEIVHPPMNVRTFITLPRSCLSIAPIAPYESAFDPNRKGYTSIGTSLHAKDRGAPPGFVAIAKHTSETFPLEEAIVMLMQQQVPHDGFQNIMFNLSTGSFDDVINGTEVAGNPSPLLLTACAVARLMKGEPAEALQDAQRAIAMAHNAAAPYLAAWRALMALGKFASALSMLGTASLLVPNLPFIPRIRVINDFFIVLDRQGRDAGSPLAYRLTHGCQRGTVARRDFAAQEAICSDVPLLVVPACIENGADCIEPYPAWCAGTRGKLTKDQFYSRLFFTYRSAVSVARSSKLQERYTVDTLNAVLLSLLAVALTAHDMVGRRSADTLDAAIAQYGLFPFPCDAPPNVGPKFERDLFVVYATLICEFPDFVKAAIDFKYFFSVWTAAMRYGIRVLVDPQTGRSTVADHRVEFRLPGANDDRDDFDDGEAGGATSVVPPEYHGGWLIVGSAFVRRHHSDAERNTQIQVLEDHTRLALTATRPILSGEPLRF